MVMDNLAFAVDAGNSRSYPGSGTTWYDLSSNRYAGTMTAGLTYSSNNGGYINFPGGHYVRFTGLSGTVMSVPESFTGMTVTLWFYPTSSGASQYVVSSVSGSGSKGFDIILQDSGNNDYLRVSSSAATWLNTNTFETLNTWQQLTLVWDKSTLFTYKNGSIINVQSSTTAGFTTAPTELCLGTLPNMLGSYTYTGRIASLFIHSRPMNATEVAQNFNALRGRFGI